MRSWLWRAVTNERVVKLGQLVAGQFRSVFRCFQPKAKHRERTCPENYKYLINNKYLFLKTATGIFLISFQTVTVFECCLMKMLPYILFEKYIYSLVLEIASAGNQHCANCIGTLSFGIRWLARWGLSCEASWATRLCSSGAGQRSLETGD